MRKYDGKLLIKPSKASIRSHLSTVRKIIKANKAAKQENLIGLLNPVLRGWANYHHHTVAKRTFARIDSQVWFMLWQWAKRRYPNKGARWVKARYFTFRKSRDWVFATMIDSQEKNAFALPRRGYTNQATRQSQNRSKPSRSSVEAIF